MLGRRADSDDGATAGVVRRANTGQRILDDDTARRGQGQPFGRHQLDIRRGLAGVKAAVIDDE